MGFPRQEYWSGLTFPPPGDLLDPGIKSTSLMSPALAGGFFTTQPPGKPGKTPWTEEPEGYSTWSLKESDASARLSTHGPDPVAVPSGAYRTIRSCSLPHPDKDHSSSQHPPTPPGPRGCRHPPAEPAFPGAGLPRRRWIQSVQTVNTGCPDNLCAGCPQPGPLGLTTVKLSCQSVALLSQTCSHPRCPGFCRPPVWVDDNIDSLSGLMLASRRGEKHSLENPLLKSTLPTHAGIPLRSRYCSCSRVWI